MDLLDSMSWLEVGLVWVSMAAAFGLAEFLLTSQTRRLRPPALKHRAGLDTERLDVALKEFSDHLDALREFAVAPPGIGREEINRLGGALDDGTLTAGGGRMESPPTSRRDM